MEDIVAGVTIVMREKGSRIDEVCPKQSRLLPNH
jgi:hypothetical protein